MCKRLPVILFIFFLSLSSLFAQETVNNASLTGIVTDTSGAVIRNATVIVRAVSTNIKSTTPTDSAGRFRFPYLQVGEYAVTVHEDGFSDAKNHPQHG